jgi:hypothetical protein
MGIWIRSSLRMRIRTHTLQMRLRIYILDEDPDSHSRWGSGDLHLRWATDPDFRWESGSIIPIVDSGFRSAPKKGIRKQIRTVDADTSPVLRIPKSSLLLRIRIRTRGQSVNEQGEKCAKDKNNDFYGAQIIVILGTEPDVPQ